MTEKENKQPAPTKEQIVREIANNRRDLAHTKSDLDLLKRERDLQKRILEFETAPENCVIIDGKPKFFTMPEYVALANEQKKFNFEARKAVYEDNVEKMTHKINVLDRNIKLLSRNHAPKEVEEDDSEKAEEVVEDGTSE